MMCSQIRLDKHLILKVLFQHDSTQTVTSQVKLTPAIKNKYLYLTIKTYY